MAPLAARRLEAMVELGARVVSIELLLAAQACDLRGAAARGRDGRPPGQGPRASRRSSRRAACFPTSSCSSTRSARDGSVADVSANRRPPAPLAHRRSGTRSRSEPDSPRSTGARCHSSEGDIADRSSHDHDAREQARDARPIRNRRCGRVVAADARARRARCRANAERLEGIWEDGDPRDLAAAAGGRIVPLAVGRHAARVRGCLGWCRRARRSECSGADARRTARLGLPVRPPRCGPRVPVVGLAGGRPSSTTRAQMQRAYLAWLANGQDRWPDVDIVFAILAGGAPIQLERLASRGVDVRSVLHPNVFFETASYGRRALELCVETFGVEQVVLRERLAGDRSGANPSGDKGIWRICRTVDHVRRTRADSSDDGLRGVPLDPRRCRRTTSVGQSSSTSHTRSRRRRASGGSTCVTTPTERQYQQLYRDPNIDVWLICWMHRQDTGYHDHDRSVGCGRRLRGDALRGPLSS